MALLMQTSHAAHAPRVERIGIGGRCAPAAGGTRRNEKRGSEGTQRALLRATVQEGTRCRNSQDDRREATRTEGGCVRKNRRAGSAAHPPNGARGRAERANPHFTTRT